MHANDQVVHLPVLDGTPVEGIPWDHPNDFPVMVHITGVQDPLALEKVERLNGYLLFFSGVDPVIDLEHTRSIQMDLNGTTPDELPEKLDCLLKMEEARFQRRALTKLTWNLFSKEFPFSVNRGIFEDAVRLTLEKMGIIGVDVTAVLNSLRREGKHAPFFGEVVKQFSSNHE